tara:strand:+ start:144 stop:533 length:390 start_codon:yes stop_codon:yes gene_type:complete
MNLSESFTLLPDDIIDKCYTYIYYPQPKSLINDIEFTYIKKKLNKFDEFQLVDICLDLIKKWHTLYARDLYDEYENEFYGINLYINTFSNYSDRIHLWINEIINLIDLDYINNNHKIKKLSKYIIFDII